MTQDLFELPGPEGNFLVGSLLELGNDPLGFLTRCDRQYGDIVPLQLGLTPACFISNPDYIEQVLKDPNLFIKSRGFRALRTLLCEGLLTNEGESWFRQRRLAQPVFHQKRIANYGATMVELTQAAIQDWKLGETRDIHADMMRLTLNIVMQTIFSSDLSEQEAHKVGHTLDVVMDWFENKRRQGFIVWEWFPRPENIRYRQAVQDLEDTIYRMIAQRRQSEEDPGDLLSMLMQARDADDNSQMSDKQLRDEVATLMLAGHETTANALSWTWMLLAQYPEVRTKLQQELQTVLGDRPPSITDLPNLRYTDRVIKESMRLYPPVPALGREVAEDCSLGNYSIPKGCAIILSQWVMHRHPRYFDDPETFRPERWENDLEKRLPRGVYIPFGDGPRVCIGKGFALMEAALILAAIAQRFQLELEPNFPIVPQPSITLRPEHGIRMQVQAVATPVGVG